MRLGHWVTIGTKSCHDIGLVVLDHASSFYVYVALFCLSSFPPHSATYHIHTTLYDLQLAVDPQKMCAFWKHGHGLTSKNITKSFDIFLQIKYQPNIHQRRWYDMTHIMRSEDCHFHKNQTFGRIDHLFVYFWTSGIGHFDSYSGLVMRTRVHCVHARVLFINL